MKGWSTKVETFQNDGNKVTDFSVHKRRRGHISFLISSQWKSNVVSFMNTKPLSLTWVVFSLVFLGLMSFFDVDEKFRFEHTAVSELRLIMDLCWRI